jgi:hypothetical protein
MNIKDIYLQLCQQPSDINEHLPVLFKYAEKCKHITEMGVRSVVSTWAFLNAKPEKLISIDIMYHPNIELAKKLAKEENINFEFKESNTLDMSIDQTDLLFIDTLHTFNQLNNELKLHGNKVNKYIIFHDTEIFKFLDQEQYDNEPKENLGPGLWPAIENFLNENKNWSILESLTNNNGLTIISNKDAL